MDEINSPMTETTLYILLSLAPGPKHGYAIAKDVQGLSNGRVVFSTSTLYTALKRLLEDEWIARFGEESEPDETGRPRKTYELTERGRRLLQLEVKRLQALTTTAQVRLAGEQL